MEKLRILVDCDDVMNNLCSVWVEEVNRTFGTNVDPNDITEWDMCKAFPNLRKEVIYEPLFWECTWNTVKPIDGAVETMRKLIDEGHELYVVTNSSPFNIELKVRSVINRYFPFISHDKIVVAAKKQLIMGDVMVDDNPENLVGGWYDGILFTAPHNKSYDAESMGLIRADNWSDVYRLISNIAKGERYDG